MSGSVRGKRVLVTGGSGVIGRELLDRLDAAGAEVLSVDRVPPPEHDWRHVMHVEKDLATDDLSVLAAFRPQVVFHLAATFERSKESPEFWKANWRDNVVCSHRVVDLAAPAVEAEVFVFASSYLVYSPALYLFAEPPAEPTRLKEDDRKAPRNLCGAAKFYTEKELDHVREVRRPSLRVVHARIFRVYGRGARDVVGRWTRDLLAGGAIEVYNGANRFSHIHARDVADGLLRMAESPDASGPINLGAERATSIDELAAILREQLALGADRIVDRGAVEEFEASGADLTRLKALTGWTPPTTLSEGVRDVIAYERERTGERSGHD